MKFNQFNIGKRLYLGFGLVLVLLVMLAMLGVRNMSTINKALLHVVDVTNVKMDVANNMRDAQRRLAIAARNIVLVKEAGARLEQKANYELAWKNYEDAATRLRQILQLPEGKEIMARIDAGHNEALPLLNKAVELGLADQPAEGTDILVKVAAPITAKWQRAIADILAHEVDLNTLDKDTAAREYANAKMFMFTISGLAVLVSTLVAWLATRSITVPLQEAVEVARSVASGDLSRSIEVTSSDETGQLLTALKEMNDSLLRIVGDVRLGTDSMATATSEIASGNLDLSSRTEQQASSLQETAASMEELTSTVKQNGENARQANALALAASDIAVKGGMVVSQVVETMASINDSSSKIVDIIAVIDGIAFQTNILALNAAVEAARAGEQGRGFAVVAAEVRNLAQRSASAAKEIKLLINDSVDKVGSGTRLVGQAGATMGDIVSSITRVTDIMSEITSAAHEQEVGIEQINRAITEMDTVTQQNAALVEEAAAAAGFLQDQAGNLAEAVKIFKLDANLYTAKRSSAVAAVPLKIKPAKRQATQAADWEGR